MVKKLIYNDALSASRMEAKGLKRLPSCWLKLSYPYESLQGNLHVPLHMILLSLTFHTANDHPFDKILL